MTNKKILILAAICIMTIMGWTAFFADKCYGAEIYGSLTHVEYVRNYDGDTITFNIPYMHPIVGRKISIRVNGIDTPEMRGKCEQEKELARRAKAVVKMAMMDAKKIVLYDIQRGKYFRIVAGVEVDGFDIAEGLIKAGLAVRYDGGTKYKDWCK